MTPFRTLGALVVFALILSTFLLFALARGAPHADTSYAVVSVEIAPLPFVAVNVPPQTVGYDVICNLSTKPSALSAKPISAVTTERRRLSTTVDWRFTLNRKGVTIGRGAPFTVLLA